MLQEKDETDVAAVPKELAMCLKEKIYTVLVIDTRMSYTLIKRMEILEKVNMVSH